jgi:uncharacterized membrane protein YdjX (TVP38/TMEM64 family)
MTLNHALRLLWIALIAISLGAYVLKPDWFTAAHVANVLSRYPQWIWAAYIGISSLRGLTLLPSTPFVLAGTLLFPDQPHWVLVSSVLCIVVSSAMIYLLSPIWQIDRHFKPHNLAYIREKLNHPGGAFFVFLWSFFPAVPTDAICYVAGTLRLRILPFLFALALGELILCAVYVYLGGSLFASVRGLV